MKEYNKEIQEILNNHNFNKEQIDEIHWGFINNLSIEQIKYYAKPEFHWEQMKQIRLGLENNLPIEEISIYANPKFDASQMYEIRFGLINSRMIEQAIYDTQPEYDEEGIYFAYGINKDLEYHKGLPINKVKEYAKPNIDWRRMYLIRECLTHNIPQEKMEYYTNKKVFNNNQMYYIARSLEINLPIEQIDLIANKKFNSNQMESIYYSFEYGLSIEQIKLFANPRYSYKQMDIYKKALRENLPIENIFNPSLTTEKMEKIINDLEQQKNKNLDNKQTIKF